jgi:hypothetical protein
LYRRCIASLWRNPGNSLKKLGVATGFETVLPP